MIAGVRGLDKRGPLALLPQRRSQLAREAQRALDEWRLSDSWRALKHSSARLSAASTATRRLSTAPLARLTSFIASST